MCEKNMGSEGARRLFPDRSVVAVKPLLNSEVVHRLKHAQEEEDMQADDVKAPRTAAANVLFDTVLKSTETTSEYQTKESTEQLRKELDDLASREYVGMDPLELIQLGNLCLETVDEAKSLFPTLARFGDADLEYILEKIKTFRLLKAVVAK